MMAGLTILLLLVGYTILAVLSIVIIFLYLTSLINLRSEDGVTVMRAIIFRYVAYSVWTGFLALKIIVFLPSYQMGMVLDPLFVAELPVVGLSVVATAYFLWATVRQNPPKQD